MQNRVGYIDAFRGILILLVIIYHLNSGGGERPIFIDFCWPFMMPGFFFISGLVAGLTVQDVKDLCGKILKKFRTLVVPAVVFYMLFAVCRGGDPLFFIYDWGGYWFTPQLFMMFGIYYICCLICRRHPRLLDALLIAVAIVGILFSVCRAVTVNPLIGSIAQYVPNGRMFGYFVAGYFANKYRDYACKAVSSEWMNTCAIMVFVMSWLLLLYFRVENNSPTVGLFIRWIAAPYSGLFAIWSFMFRFRDFFDTDGSLSRVIRFVGRRSLDIYMLHPFFLYLYGIGGLPSVKAMLFDCDNIAVQFVCCLVMAAVVSGMSVLCSEIIRSSRFLTWLLLGGSCSRHAPNESGRSSA